MGTCSAPSDVLIRLLSTRWKLQCGPRCGHWHTTGLIWPNWEEIAQPRRISVTCQSLITPSHLFSILSSCLSGNILYHRTLQQCAIDNASDGETVTHYLPKPGAHEHSEGKYVLDVGTVGSYCKSSSPDRRPKAWSGTALLTLLPTSTRTPSCIMPRSESLHCQKLPQRHPHPHPASNDPLPAFLCIPVSKPSESEWHVPVVPPTQASTSKPGPGLIATIPPC